MDKDQVRGKAEQAVGKVKKNVGEATGSEHLANQGVADQAKGAARETWGNVKDAAHESAEEKRKAAKERADEARERTSEKIDNAKDEINERIDEHRTRRAG